MQASNIYLDTNFILDITEGRNNNSTHIIEQIRENKWKCYSSVFTLMEICDVKKDDFFVAKKLQEKWSISQILRERYKKDLNKNDFDNVDKYIRNKILESYKFIEFVRLSDEAWEQALRMSTFSNINTADIMHLITALTAKCDIFLTSDKHFIGEAKRMLKQLNNTGLNIYMPVEYRKILASKKNESI